MATFRFNITKGRDVELFNRVDSNDPGASAIVIIPLSATDTEANRQDDDDVTTFLAAAPNELTTGGWVRKVLTDTELAAIAVDDVNNRFPATIPAITYTAPSAGTVVGFLLAYDADTAAGTDANLLPISCHDVNIVSDGNDVIINAGDVSRTT